jgi:GDPmannose 4,6-dehydratase
LYRPADVHHLRGDASRALSKLGWNREVSFEELVEMMVDADLERLVNNEGGRRTRSATQIFP